MGKVELEGYEAKEMTHIMSSKDEENIVNIDVSKKEFTFKITSTDSEDAPLKDAVVTITLEGSAFDGTTTTGEDGTTTNADKKFEFGSKVTITVTKTGYFAKKED